MKYKLEITDKTKKQFKKLDKPTAALIIGWLEKNIEGSDNPRIHGKALVQNIMGKWRYRIGSYRVICCLQDDRVVVLDLEVRT